MKNTLFYLVLITTGHSVIGSASSSQQLHVPMMASLSPEIMDLAIAHLPATVRTFANMIEKKLETADFILFYGPPGTSKTTTALAIGQKYYAERAWGFRGSDLLGNQYQNSAKEIMNASLIPIIRRASEQPQYIVIDEIQKFAKKGKNDSGERSSAIAHFWSLTDEMRKTSNIMLVGTCNSVAGFPKALEDRFGLLSRFKFDGVANQLYAEVCKYYLAKSAIPNDINSTMIETEVAPKLRCSVRQVEHIVKAAKRYAFTRDPLAPKIQKDDVIAAIEEMMRLQNAKTESWEKSLKRHEHKTQAVSSYGGVALAVTGLCVTAGVVTLQHHYRKQDDIKHRENLESSDRALAFQKATELKREADGADYCCFVPTCFQSGYLNASPEGKDLVIERQNERWEARGETFGVSGDTAKTATQVGVPLTIAGGGVALAVKMGAIAACTIS